MPFSENETFRLWHSFKPRQKEIVNKLARELFSIKIYPEAFDFSF